MLRSSVINKDQTDGVCPICGGTEITDFRFGLFRCNCEAVLNGAVWREGTDLLLESEWFDSGAFDPRSSFWTSTFEEWTCSRTQLRLVKAGLKEGRLLEVGVGHGALLSYMSRRGFSVEGCDMAEAICAHVERTLGHKMHRGSLQSILGQQEFDVIVMNHVLEHVSDPIDLLRAARRLLKRNGVLHIALPNIDSWEAHLSGWTGYQPYHLVYFNRVSVSTALRESGLSPISVATYEPFSGWFNTVVRSAIGRRNKTQGAGSSQPSVVVELPYRLISLLAGAASWPLRKLQDSLNKGEELVVLARVSERV